MRTFIEETEDIRAPHPMRRFATVFPGPKGWFPLLIGILAIASFPTGRHSFKD